ncbi:hypothetical protein H0H92_003425 [Tricholoma furcatifolium]|nr:hypothetical protein H0H92_003425 [Tricholoma furcatifolium]
MSATPPPSSQRPPAESPIRPPFSQASPALHAPFSVAESSTARPPSAPTSPIPPPLPQTSPTPHGLRVKTYKRRRQTSPVKHSQADAAASPNSKRRKVLATTLDPPPWFVSARSMLEDDGEVLGQEWLKLVDVWASFESRHSYKEVRKLSSAGRPGFIADWIKRARNPRYRPITAASLESTQKGMLSWWASLSRDDASACPGVNGILSVLAGLLMWGVAIPSVAEERRVWMKMVTDVHNLLLST